LVAGGSRRPVPSLLEETVEIRNRNAQRLLGLVPESHRWPIPASFNADEWIDLPICHGVGLHDVT
ncbi:MAG: hypothetical protein P8P71_10445, partial [Phycisphaerales bacterium]|nr:hypothetical protein [Phycisphaerales bacterium]